MGPSRWCVSSPIRCRSVWSAFTTYSWLGTSEPSEAPTANTRRPSSGDQLHLRDAGRRRWGPACPRHGVGSIRRRSAIHMAAGSPTLGADQYANAVATGDQTLTQLEPLVSDQGATTRCRRAVSRRCRPRFERDEARRGEAEWCREPRTRHDRPPRRAWRRAAGQATRIGATASAGRHGVARASQPRTRAGPSQGRVEARGWRIERLELRSCRGSRTRPSGATVSQTWR